MPKVHPDAMPHFDDDSGLLRGLIGDGRPLLSLTAVTLFLSGAFAVFLSIRREFLPHDVAYLGMSAEALCAIAECRIVRFMFHDRVAFGSTLIAVATLYLWLASFPLRQGFAWAWWGLLGTGAGIAMAGFVILVIGTTDVFVAEDLAFIGLTREALDGINPRLVPLIAHDRAGFGGGLATTGVLLSVCGWYAPPTRAFHHAVVVAGVVGFGCALGTHFVEGYVNPWHLVPAFAGAALFATSLLCELSGSRQMRAHAGEK